jgi:hypothetical protein
MRLPVSLVTTVTVVAAVAGCGGGDTPTTTTAEFARAATKVCAAAGERLERASAGLGSGPDQVVQFADESERILNATFTELDKLELPAGQDGDKARRYLELTRGTFDDAKSLLDQLRVAARAGDVDRVAELAQQITTLNGPEASRLATELGIDDCDST